MNNDNSSLIQLIEEHVLYHASIGLAICRPCGSAFPHNIERHLRRFHGSLSLQERRALVSHLDSLPGRRPIEQITMEYSSDNEVDAIEGLPITTGCKCNCCGLLSSISTMEKHCKEHDHNNDQRNIKTYFS